MIKLFNKTFLTFLLLQFLIIFLSTTAWAMDLKLKIDPLAEPLIKNNTAVGLIIGIVRDGETQILAYGEKTKGTNVSPDGETLFEIGSVSKVFTGILLADMVEKGIVKLEDPVQEYLPEGVSMPVYDGKIITLEHLATHTSGLPRLPDNLALSDLTNPYAEYSEAQIYEFLNGYKLIRPPGKYEYSNFGMGLLGHLLARKAGKSYEQCITDQICKPAGMTDTFIGLDEDRKTRMATPYNTALNQVSVWDFTDLAGCGGIRSNANDMINFIKANLNNDNSPFTRAVKISHIKRHDINKGGVSIGLGWHIIPEIGLCHDGGTGGFCTWISILPEKQTGIFMMTNTGNLGLLQLGPKIMRVALGLETAAPESRTEVDVSPDLLKSYENTYKVEITNTLLSISFENDRLMAVIPVLGRLQLFAESNTDFFIKAADIQISFVTDKDGKTDHLILHAGGQDLKAFPVKVIKVRPDVLESYTGIYSLAPDVNITVTADNNKLMAQATGQGKIPFYPESETEFFCKLVDARIIFKPDQEGKIDHMILRQGGIDQTVKRKGDVIRKKPDEEGKVNHIILHHGGLDL